MSADMLREAARLMRERAEGARAGKWKVRPSSLTPDAVLVTAEWANDSCRVATCAGSLPEGNVLNAEHIASWHPAVALMVADLLHMAADHLEGRGNPCDSCVEKTAEVARAYLGQVTP